MTASSCSRRTARAATPRAGRRSTPRSRPISPAALDGVGPPGGGGGNGGGIGFNLRDGDEIRRFGNDESGGFAAQVDFVQHGSIPFKGYGNSGIGSGRMPGFADMLTTDQIAEIVSYERYCLDTSTFLSVAAGVRDRHHVARAAHHHDDRGKRRVDA